MASLASPSVAAGSLGGGGSSATVLEFVCLFTHDLRRKQKRWQDGRLKYHTFNKRVMVYDDRGNSVGDMYWLRNWEFDEGEEIELERGGVIVQVAECVGRQNQDLSELIDKRQKEKEQRAAARPAAHPVPMHTPLTINRTPVAQRDYFQTRHRPLNQLLGTPTGHHGRALVPTESPYEQRHAADRTPDEESSSRAQKRRRYDDMPSSKQGYAQALFGAPLTLSGAPMSSAPIRRPPLPRPQSRIDLTSSQEDGLSNSRPVEITEERDQCTNRPSPVREIRTAPRRVENFSRAPVAIARVPIPSVRKEIEPQPRDEEYRDVAQQPDHSSSRRGVSSHFGNASEESQRRASLLKNSGLARAQARDPPPVTVDKRADEGIQAPNQQVFKTRQPEPISIPDDEQDYGEIHDLEEETLFVPSRREDINKTTRRAPEPEKGLGQHERNVGRSTGLFKPNSFAHSTTDTEPEAPPARAPDPSPPIEAPPVQAPEKELRTELRIKSRGRRGLLLMTEMAKEAPLKKKRKKRAPTPEIPVETSLEEQYDIPDQDLLDVPDPAPPQATANDHPQNARPFYLDDPDPFASPEPAARKDTSGAAREAAQADPDDSDPFASLEAAMRKGTSDAPREAARADPDDSDPFASPEAVLRKRSELSSRRERGRAKQTLNNGHMDMHDDDGPSTFGTSSPELIEAAKATSREKATPRATVYDIPDDTDEEQLFLPRRERSPTEPKKRANARDRNKKPSRRHSTEEDVASNQESEDLPRARTTRTGKRKVQKAPREEEYSGASAKNKRARPVLAFISDEPSSEEDVPMPPPKVSKTTKASKTSKAAKPTKGPRLGTKLKSTVKSREVFGFVMSSSPPPPVLGGAAVSNNGVNRDLTDPFSAPALTGTGYTNGADSTSTTTAGKPDANPAPNSRANFGAHSLQDKNTGPAIVPTKEAVATSATGASHGELNRQEMGADDRAGATRIGGVRLDATISTERSHDNRVPLPPATDASAPGANKGPAAPQLGILGLRRESSGGLCDVGSGTRGGLSTNTVSDPVPPQTRGRQTITAGIRPEKPSTTAEDGVAIMPRPPGPPSRPAPPIAPQAQTRVQAPVPPPTALVPPTTTSAGSVAVSAPPLPASVAVSPASVATATTSTTINTVNTSVPGTTPSVNITATTGTSAAAAAAAPVAVFANVPPRIPNPASRGRKAALKSDAKGQTPQSILPPPEPLADRSNLVANRAAARPAGAGAGANGQEERPKLKMTFPGFVSAKEGGPWSRHSHDLLEGGRPD